MLDLFVAAAFSGERLGKWLKALDAKFSFVQPPAEDIKSPGLLERLVIPKFGLAMLAVIHPIKGSRSLAVVDPIPRCELVQLCCRGVWNSADIVQ